MNAQDRKTTEPFVLINYCGLDDQYIRYTILATTESAKKIVELEWDGKTTITKAMWLDFVNGPCTGKIDSEH